MAQKIIQWNINGIKTHYEELQTLVGFHKPLLILIQETYLKQMETFHFKNYTCVRKDRLNTARASGGILTLIKNSLPHYEIPLNTNYEANAISTCILGKRITICNLYIPPNGSFSQTDFRELVSYLPKPFIIMGDLNAHNYAWGSASVNSRGREVHEVISELNLIIMNDGAPTHFSSAYGSLTNIDLTICSPETAGQYQWSVMEDCYGSDHFPTSLELLTWSNTKNKKAFNYKKADWTLYKSSFIPPSHSNDIESMVQDFTDAIINAAKESIPEIEIRFDKPPVPWWNEKCKEAIKNRKKALTKSI